MLRGFVDDAIYGKRSKLLNCEPDLKSTRLELESTTNSNDLAEFVFYSDRKPSYITGSKLRRKIYRKLKETDLLLQKHVADIVNEFVKELPTNSKTSENNLIIHEEFTCQCGWLLYDPTTLPCGHTFCKKCVQENKFCLDCGSTLPPSSCHVSPLLVDIISTWFGSQYISTGHKNQAKNFFSKNQFSEALNSINEALKLTAEDYTALNLRVETRYSLEKYEDALLDAELSCKINDKCGKSHFIRGLCHLALKNYDQAIDAFQLSMEVEPEDGIMVSGIISNLSKVFSVDTDNDGDAKSNLIKIPNFDYLEDDVFCSFNTEESLYNLDNEVVSKVQSITNVANSNCIETVCENESINGIPLDLINEETFECKLCYDLLYQPVTMTCGHVFCKTCLVKTLDYNAVCPICRLELADYRKKPTKPVTILLDNILRTYMKEQFSKRNEEHMVKMKELAKVGTDETVDHPIFICAIAFPNVECPLHIFEPKYRQLIRDCLESGGCKFAMCAPQKEDEYSNLGTILTVTSYEVLDDGRFIIRTVAGKRFECKEKFVKDSINYASVKYLEDDEIDSNAEEFCNTTREIYDTLSRYIESLQEEERTVLFNALGKLPPYEKDTKAFPDGLPWVWYGLAVLPLNFTAKVALLSSKTISARLKSLQRFLKFLCK